jgi:ATP-dependent Lon protease
MSEEKDYPEQEETLVAEESQASPNIVIVSELLPDKLTILPIEPRPVFPNIMIPLTFTGEKIIQTIREVTEKQNSLLGISLVKKENKDNFLESELYEVGTVVKILRVNPVSENMVQVLAQGLQRFRRTRVISHDPAIQWEVKYHYESQNVVNDELKAYAMAIMSSVRELLKLNPMMQEPLKMLLAQMSYDKSIAMMDIVSSILSTTPDKMQDLLETLDMRARAEKLLIYLKEEIELATLQENIQKQIEEKVSKQQKDFFLREQLKIIKKELGLEKDDKTAEIEKFENRIKDLKLTSEASKVINEEMDKLRMLESNSAEYHVTRTYLEFLTELPWGVYSADNTDIAKARQILNEQHYGLDDVKNSILEFISTMNKRGSQGGSIICLVGPPGVGKTSIGKSVADALDRKFYRFSVGGMRDEAEIKGHRRTYIGAMPGKIIQSLKRTGVSNPVIMLDEIDKIGTSYQGDPASALLEVLDPEQNKDFLDHYLDVRFDLSDILFITTANQLDTIPQPLLDRMEVIKLSGYILEEKFNIAQKYLIPKQMKEHGLQKKELQITPEGLTHIIDKYAREAGVRNLENQLKKIMRQVTLKMTEDPRKKYVITPNNVEQFLGKPFFSREELYEKSIPGVTLGLAWTAMGGATLYIEANALKSKGPGFKQTGKLGEVMTESSEIAYSYVRSLLSNDDEKTRFFDEHAIHLHVPEGATPKDGPSAGITMALALYSLAVNKPVKQGLAMTGEITLTGKVLPIGGVKEKTIAAKRVGVHELIFPKDNKYDFEHLPEHVKKDIKVHFVNYFDDVLKVALAEK